MRKIHYKKEQFFKNILQGFYNLLRGFCKSVTNRFVILQFLQQNSAVISKTCHYTTHPPLRGSQGNMWHRDGHLLLVHK